MCLYTHTHTHINCPVNSESYSFLKKEICLNKHKVERNHKKNGGLSGKKRHKKNGTE